MRRRLPAIFTVIVFVLGLVHVTAAMGDPPLIPPKNLPLGELPLACTKASTILGPTCENGVIYYLDQAREAIGLPQYRLPANFTALAPDKQILILTNLDRSAYQGLAAVTGLNSDLTAAAETGVANEADPLAPLSLTDGWNGFQSNWAGWGNALMGYYVWAYDDGYGSRNLDCQEPDSPGCWGHRETILNNMAQSGLFMGASAGSKNGGKTGSAMIIAVSQADPPLYYTWAEAQAEGAGTYPYDPGVPILESDALPLSLALSAKWAGVHRVTIKIRGTHVLVGRPIEVRVSHQYVPCALPKARPHAPCHWVSLGKRSTKKMVLGSKSEITVTVREWERAAIHVQSEPFNFGGLHYRSVMERTVVLGPKPHRVR
jgi:hypothetical protein